MTGVWYGRAAECRAGQRMTGADENGEHLLFARLPLCPRSVTLVAWRVNRRPEADADRLHVQLQTVYQNK